MKIAVAGWHYSHRTLNQNAEYFLKNGFDLFSALGKDFAELMKDRQEAEKLAETLQSIAKERGEPSERLLTVHYGLPDPTKREDVEAFYASLEEILAWEERFGRLRVLSFDVWYPNVFPLVEHVVRQFAETKVRVAFEDYCLDGLDADHAELMNRYPFYELVDAGHMNFRLFGGGGDHSVQGFHREFDKLGLPVIETHIHNNNGLRDMHRPLLDPEMLALDAGSFDTEAYLTLLRDRGLNDVIVTIETMPFLYGNPGVFGDAIVLNDLKYVRVLCEKLEI